MQPKNRRSKQTKQNRRSRRFGTTKTNKGVGIFSKQQIIRDLVVVLFDLIATLKDMNMTVKDRAELVVKRIVVYILGDAAMMLIFDKLFGSHRNWDYFTKIMAFVKIVVNMYQGWNEANTRINA